MAYLTLCMAGFLGLFLALGYAIECWESNSPSLSQQGGFDLGTGSNVTLTPISGWASRAQVQLMVPGDGLGHFCGLWVERRLPALLVFWKGPSLEKSKAGRVTEIKKKK